MTLHPPLAWAVRQVCTPWSGCAEFCWLFTSMTLHPPQKGGGKAGVHPMGTGVQCSHFFCGTWMESITELARIELYWMHHSAYDVLFVHDVIASLRTCGCNQHMITDGVVNGTQDARGGRANCGSLKGGSHFSRIFSVECAPYLPTVLYSSAFLCDTSGTQL